MTTHLHLDFETRCRIDIKKAGLDRYAREAEVLMCAWAVNDEPVQLWLPQSTPLSGTGYCAALNGRLLPEDLLGHLCDPEATKVAWNAAFERLILKYALGIEVPVEQWLDPAILARYAALPSHLISVSEVLKLGAAAKDKEGTRLIRMFCTPGKRGHKTPAEAPEDWQKFQEYCKQDVISERAVLCKLKAFGLPEQEQRLLALDQKINDRGIPVDIEFVHKGIETADRERERILAEMKGITGLENPNSNKQLLGWLRAQGYPFTSLGKAFVKRALAE